MKQRAVWGIIVIAGALLVQGCTAPEPTQDLLALTEARVSPGSAPEPCTPVPAGSPL